MLKPNTRRMLQAAKFMRLDGWNKLTTNGRARRQRMYKLLKDLRERGEKPSIIGSRCPTYAEA